MKRSQTMLKRTYIAAFLVASAFAAWLVALQRQENLQAAIPIENRTVMLEVPSGKNEVPSQNTIQQRAKITPLPGEIFLKTIDVNLDDDEDFEQVILSKKSTASTSLEIVVADFSQALGVYFRHFEGPIAATKLDSIIIQPMDVTADGLSDLLVQGLDASNDQTLTIFRRLSDRGYVRVFSGAGSEVTLQDPDNSGGASAASIVVQTPSDSPGMVVQTAYTWNNRLSSFEKKSETSVRQNNAFALGSGGTDAQVFLSWLNRLWTRNTDASDPRSLFLDVKNNALIFGDQQIQQRWIIKSAERNENRLYLTCSTSEASDLDRVVVIDAKAQDEIAVGIIDQQGSHFRRDEGWSGTYSGVAPVAALPQSIMRSEPNFDIFFGRYLGNDDSVLVLGPSKSIIVIDKKYREGIAKFYDYHGYQVLDFLQIKPNGLAGERLLFVVSAEQSGDGAIRRVRLEPAQVGPDGVRIDYRPPYEFTKTS